MISRILPKIISAGLLVASAVLVCVFAPSSPAQTSGDADAQGPQLDYEFFKTRVEPIFLKKRSDDPDWKNMKAWVLGQKAGGSSTP